MEALTVKWKTLSLNRLIFLGLIVFSVIPDIGLRFSTVGFTWTMYRLMVPLGTAFVLAGVLSVRLQRGTVLTRWILFMLFWVVYGIVLLFVGRYSDRHNGFVEWLSVCNGLLVMYTMSFFLTDRENLEDATRLLYWLLNLLVLFGLAEIATGRHWFTSAFHDAASAISTVSDPHQATGFMYNMNDFSALLTCLTPVLTDKKLGRLRYATLAGVLLINLKNDATTCTLAILLFAVVYLLTAGGGKTLVSLLFRLAFGVLFLAGLAFLLLPESWLAGRSGFVGALARQIINARSSSGSLFARLTIYKDALRAWVSTGMLGMGPRGFTNYFQQHKSASGLVNPHALILEVLTQYGIVVASWLVGLLVSMYRKARVLLDAPELDRHTAGLMVMAFVVIYFVVSFAPSSFIGFTYPWILIAVMSAHLDNSWETGEIRYA